MNNQPTQINSVEINGTLVNIDDEVKVARNGNSYTGKVKKILEFVGVPKHLQYQVVVLPFGGGSIDSMEPISINHVISLKTLQTETDDRN